MSMRLIATILTSLSADGFIARQATGRRFQCDRTLVRRGFPVLLLLAIFVPMVVCRLTAAEPDAIAAKPAPDGIQADSHFNVRRYAVSGNVPLAADTLDSIFSSHTGTNVDLKEIVRAAADLQTENRRQGHPEISVAIMPEKIASGIVTLNVFQAAYPQIVVAGRRYLDSGELAGTTIELPAIPANATNQPPIATADSNATPPMPVISRPASPEELAESRTALMKAMDNLATGEKDMRIHLVSTNAGPHFDVEKYLVAGNSVLPPKAIATALTNIDGAFGTNVVFEGIGAVRDELQKAYRERGYVTVAVAVPKQSLTNATVKIQVTEGRLAEIRVKGNHYFSSNNVMRTLPSLHTNMLLNGPIFNTELNRANANQDRQIYPVISPGADPGTSELTLNVKDRFPLHGKVELNNESSPGTPDLRLNSSAVYNNLWNLDQSVGFQYGFSPQQFKTGSWPLYDEPLVANYGMFYRVPIGNPQPVEDVVEGSSGSFGYDETTHKFNLPPPIGQPDFTVLLSRSTIDTGLQTLSATSIFNSPSLSINQQNVQGDLTVNQDIGARWNVPLVTPDNVQLNFSGGLDYKTYQVSSYKTNLFLFNQVAFNAVTLAPESTNSSTIASPVPTTVRQIQYLPLTFRTDASWRDIAGTSSLGLGLNINPWYSSQTYVTSATGVISTDGGNSLQAIANSPKSTGYWVVINPSYTRTFMFFTNWITSLRVDGQWASQPLISNEQFGIGGVNSVRGYHEGEAVGDTGWHLSLEQQTPTHLVGMVHGNMPLTLRGSIYMDYAMAYLLDPQGYSPSTSLWGTGIGVAASVGSHWQANFLFSVPLISTSFTTRNEPYFNFSMTAQF